MKRGMITLHSNHIQKLKEMDNSTQLLAANQKLPEELQKKLQYTAASTQSLEISEETAQSFLDLLPPQHTITDPVLKQLHQIFYTFIQAIHR